MLTKAYIVYLMIYQGYKNKKYAGTLVAGCHDHLLSSIFACFHPSLGSYDEWHNFPELYTLKFTPLPPIIPIPHHLSSSTPFLWSEGLNSEDGRWTLHLFYCSVPWEYFASAIVTNSYCDRVELTGRRRHVCLLWVERSSVCRRSWHFRSNTDAS